MLEFRNLRKVFKNKTVINDISFTVNKGEFVVIVGQSGCGKTTTLKMINKLILPTSGSINLDGKNIFKEDTIKLRRNMGYVIQQTGLLPHMTVGENIGIIPMLEKWPEEKILARTNELLEMVGMKPEEYINRYPCELSGGQQQRIGVARAWATNPDVILMDEPFSALDPITRNQLQDELFNLQQESKKTIVFVTHDMDEALKLGDRICIMKDGNIVQYDTPEEILNNPANDFVKEFIGKNRIWQQPGFIRAKDIMITEPITTSGNRTVVQALEIMKANKVDSLLIINKQDKLEGIVTIKDIIRNYTGSLRVNTIMGTEIKTVNLEDSLVDILNLMNELKIGYVPVVDDGSKLVGLITESSLLIVLSNQYINQEDEE
ncbi:ABC transporter ATP-binding protein [Clostridium estertheticum]|uniref:Quaternary amine transport ATP-binding protein n=2 Tax=Clostridium estertheticum TaxID=238834 RepID=A0A1J0GLC9_9CLOT|nr:ABC transporter ATP-binding protein [Clostridium estertheticum]APC42188.1 proline/glycine betaine ABC transporter ATP-binding protein [Clostridium estertheticum subsp. estertheticum]MBU3073723.1 ABC transporter ATP-binding protein [Clostridium estertheticum]MBU3163816.1 ABC transporter ATP-binding protein [Clostridium estertheticum]MBU3172365.1 ABC transporter ATP-binding protein [Clostridium estertheticum]MBU3184212.1 ABC transporter ATP-binding protein [Clostridium estertheticum]